MAMLARNWDQVMAREYTSRGTPQQQWDDALGIASAIYNRSVAMGVPYDTVVQNKSQFNGYMNRMSPGDMARMKVAQEAMAYVEENGPVHTGMYFATPRAVAGLPSGLVDTGYAVETGHVFKADPYGRSIQVKGGKYIKPDLQALDQQLALQNINAPVPQARPADVPLGVPTPEVNPMDLVNAGALPVGSPLAASAVVPGIDVPAPQNALPAEATAAQMAAANFDMARMAEQGAAPKTSRTVEPSVENFDMERMMAQPTTANFDPGRFSDPTAAGFDPGRMAQGYDPNFGPAMADLSSALQPDIPARATMAQMAAQPGASAAVEMGTRPSISDPATVGTLNNELDVMAQAEPGQLYQFEQTLAPSMPVDRSVTSSLASALTGGMTLGQAVAPSASTQAAQSAMFNGIPADPANPGFWGDLAAQDANLSAAAALSPASDAAARAAMSVGLPSPDIPEAQKAAAQDRLDNAPPPLTTASTPAISQAEIDARIDMARTMPLGIESLGATEYSTGTISPLDGATQDMNPVADKLKAAPAETSTETTDYVDPVVVKTDLPAAETRQDMTDTTSEPDTSTDTPSVSVPDSQESLSKPTNNAISNRVDTRGPLSRALGLPANPISSFVSNMLGLNTTTGSVGVNNLGGGLANVASVYGGAVPGTQAYTSNGGLVEALTGGAVGYTNPYGVRTITLPGGQQAADWSNFSWNGLFGLGANPGGGAGSGGGTSSGGPR